MDLRRFVVVSAIGLGLLTAILAALGAPFRLAQAQTAQVTVHEAPTDGEATPLADAAAVAGINATNPGSPTRVAEGIPGTGDGFAIAQKGTRPPNQDSLLLETAFVSPDEVSNGNFELGPSGWQEFSSHGWPIILHVSQPRDNLTLPAGFIPHSGSWAAWLGGELDEVSYVRQAVSLVRGRVTLKFWYGIVSQDECGYDFGGVIVNNNIVVDVFTLCESTSTPYWIQRSVDLSAFSGQTISVQIRVETDNKENSYSSLFVDDVTLEVVPSKSQSFLPLIKRGKPVPPGAPPCGPSNGYCEPFNSCLTAYGPLGPDQPYSAYPEDRNDYYAVELATPSSLSVIVTGYTPEDGQLVLRDPNDLRNPIVWGSPDGHGVMQVQASNLQPGTYCIQVFTGQRYYQTTNLYTLMATTP